MDKNELESRRALLCEKYFDISKISCKFMPEEQYREDLASDVFMLAYMGIGGVRDMEKLDSWLYAIAKRRGAAMMSEIREQRYVEHLADNEELKEIEEWKWHQTGAANPLVSKMNQYVVVSTISSLDERTCNILVKYYIEGYSLKEIAESLNLNYNTVRTIQNRGLRKLRKILEADDGSQDRED